MRCCRQPAARSIPFAGSSIVIGLPAGVIMALSSEALRPENRATGMGVFYTWHFIAMAVLPSLAGAARELDRRAAAPILFAAFRWCWPRR